MSLTRLLPGLLVLSLTGCLQSAGDFGGVSWHPGATWFAVADRHTLVDTGGTLLATQRSDAGKRVTMLFTGASANPHLEWRRATSRTLLSLRQDLASTDGLLLSDVPLDALVPGAQLERHEGTGVPDEPRDFDASIVVAGDQVTAATEQGFGSDIEMKLTIEEADPRAHGFIQGSFELKRGRGDEQAGDVATGAITLTFNLPVVAERRGKANLAIAEPIMICAGKRGPARAASCADEPSLEVPEAADAISGLD